MACGVALAKNTNYQQLMPMWYQLANRHGVLEPEVADLRTARRMAQVYAHGLHQPVNITWHTSPERYMVVETITPKGV